MKPTSHHMLMYSDVLQACNEFYNRYGVIPDTVKFSYKDLSELMSNLPFSVNTLEKGKQYSNYLAIPGGLVELAVMEHNDESIGGNLGAPSFFVVESNHVDREFEKIILNKDQS